MGNIVKKSSDKMVIVYCLYPNKLNANQMIKKLLKNKLIVCANVLQGIESHYTWKNKIETSKEVIVLFKSVKSKSALVKKLIESEHPYDVPFVGELSLKRVNASYLKYALENLSTT